MESIQSGRVWTVQERVLNSLRDNKNKSQERNNHKKSSDVNAHIQLVDTKLINEQIKYITYDNATKKILFSASEADAESWVEEAMNKIKSKHGSIGAATVSDMMK